MAATSTASEPIDWSKTNMKYKNLGRSGLKVSVLSLGSWTTYGTVTDSDIAYDCMTKALRLGVNFFDNAEAYASGKSEVEMGNIFQRWFKEGICKRSDLVVSTKLFFGANLPAGIAGNPNAKGCSHKHLLEGIDASLARLQLDYVDLLFCHRPDPLTPIEETVRAMNIIINQGKAFYWGTSEWSAHEITQAHAVAQRLNLIPPLMEQPQYNLFCRNRFEIEYQPLYATYGMGTTIWSPLASGLLTGKYNSGKVPEGARLSFKENDYLRKQYDAGKFGSLEIKDLTTMFDQLERLKPIAEKLGTTLAVLALAWCLKNPNVSTVITGASRPSQIEENFKALDIVDKLTPEVLQEIESVVQTKPTGAQDWGRGTVRLF